MWNCRSAGQPLNPAWGGSQWAEQGQEAFLEEGKESAGGGQVEGRQMVAGRRLSRQRQQVERAGLGFQECRSHRAELIPTHLSAIV